MENTPAPPIPATADILVIVVTGVAGSGKTTVGRALAARLHWRFCDADDLHSPESVGRIRNGDPLDDEMRQPWLLRVRRVIAAALRDRAGTVVACSALKEQYRRVLADGLRGIRFVFLTADRDVIRQRLERRPDHFAGPAILASQLEALEPPSNALTLDATRSVADLVRDVCHDIGRT